LLALWSERFRLKLHAYVLIENHYHLLLETAEANLSAPCSGSTSATRCGLTGGIGEWGICCIRLPLTVSIAVGRFRQRLEREKPFSFASGPKSQFFRLRRLSDEEVQEHFAATFGEGPK